MELVLQRVQKGREFFQETVIIIMTEIQYTYLCALGTFTWREVCSLRFAVCHLHDCLLQTAGKRIYCLL